MEQEQYEYEEKEEKPKPVEGAEVDETDMDDYDAYESIWDEIKYPKPEDSKVEAKQIHKPSETRVVAGFIKIQFKHNRKRLKIRQKYTKKLEKLFKMSKFWLFDSKPNAEF